MYNDNIAENHRGVEDQKGNNLLEIETLPLFPIHGGSQHDFFDVKASDLSSNHSVGGYYTARMVEPHMDIMTDFPTQRDTGETSNDLTQAKCNEFKELYASANKELYPGCDYVTRLDFMANFTYFKVKGKDIDVYLRPLIDDLKAIDGGPIRPQWMYPFESFMKKLKNYVRNKAKLKGSIAKGYVVEEALTFSFYYFRDVTTKFNRPDGNVDCPPPTLIWYVIHNIPEIDKYWAKFKSEFPNKDMKEEFLGWFGKQVNFDLFELFALACGPSQTPISVNYCIVNGVRFVVHSRDEGRTTQNSNICSPGPDIEMYYENHREVEDQKGNNSPEIETLPLFPIHGGSQHDFFGMKPSDLSSDHNVG
nr:hypothetical protein [Tanacetum cinerariifolium]